jgi:enoyl-CoA hydratase/carnithine racemase
LRIGLVDQVAAPDQLLSTARKLAETIAAQAPIAVKYVKEAVHSGLSMPLDQGLRLEQDLFVLLEGTEDRIEGADAFVEKRRPVWSGR